MIDSIDDLQKKINDGRVEKEMTKEMTTNTRFGLAINECARTLLEMVDEDLLKKGDEKAILGPGLTLSTHRQLKTSTFLYSFLRLLESMGIITIIKPEVVKKDMKQVAMEIFNQHFKKI